MTERHCDQSFSYEIPIKEDGTYVLILKFAEVINKILRCIFNKQVKGFLTYDLEHI